MRRKILRTTYVEPETLEQLKKLSELTGIPVAKYVRDGIDLVLDAHQDKMPGQLELDLDEP